MGTRRAVLIRGVCLILLLIVNTARSESNVAVFKTATQSSELGNTEWVASKVVDNCLQTTIGSNCCTHTNLGQEQVWWRVDLREPMTINTITIYYRNAFQQRLAGYQLYLSNTTESPTSGALCYEDKSSTRAAVQLLVTHQCPYVARYVTVYNYRNTPTRYEWYATNAILELCEVQVFGCQVGRHGNGNCDSLCPTSCYGGNCNPKTGSCFYCSPGKYGDNCNLVCSTTCKDNICGKDTGFCFECVPQKYGNTCVQDCSVNCQNRLCAKDTGNCNECVAQKYGNTCEHDCSVDCKDRLCARVTGHCNECVSGKYGNICEHDCSVNCKDSLCVKDTGYCIECNPTTHGVTCELNCSVGCQDMLCAKDTGYCAECVAGKHGNTCFDDCPVNCKDNVCFQDTGVCNECIPTKRGATCELDCPPNCFNGVCDKNSASCSSCVERFYGMNCSIPCSNNCSECDQQSGECTKCTTGLYGMNCSMPCGHCGVCGLNSGLCETECDPGYEGGFCKKRQAQTANPSTPTVDAGPIVGSIVAVLLVVVVAIVIVIFIRRRRLRDSKQDSFDDIGRSRVPEKSIYSEPLETGDSHVDRDNPRVSGENVYSNTLVSEEDPDEPPKDTANVYMNAEQVARKSDSGDSVYYNSGPVGFPVYKLKSLVQTKMQNKAKAFEIEYKSIPSGALHEHNIGMLQQNKAKNRFKTTFPYDHSRVILDTIGKDPHSDYINANYIDSVTKTAEYIATQGPRPGTVNDFWRMIWQLKSGKIIMLTNLIEGSRPKCDKYWPDEGEPLSTAQFNIVLDRERAYAFYVIRDLVVTEKKTRSVRQIHQFHYTTWPDHGTPDPNELVVFHRRVKHYETVLSGKMVVHCSAGIGRTGTFLALDALLDYGKESGRIDVMQYVKNMRKDRINMVQTAEQYIAIHQLLVEAFDMPDTLIPRMKYHTALNALSNDGPTNQTKLRKEYQLTQTLKPNYDEADCKAALQATNKKKNRTLTVLAVDKFRAYLRSHASDRTDYINAVAVPSYTSKTGYIVTQTPMNDTVVDLLTMVMDHSCQTIVVIDTDAVNWLPDEEKDKTIGGFTLEQKGKSSTIANVDLIELAIENQMTCYNAIIRVFHLSGWDRDSSVPADSSCLLQLLELVDSRRKSDDTKTTVVMCRDGYSQSGLFCCISNARDQMKADEEVDIFQISRQLLVRRPEFLINLEQYQCCYKIIKEYLDTTDVYMN